MKIEKLSDGWWIVGVPPYEAEGETFHSCGPYKTKAEAESDKRGLQRTYDLMKKEKR